MKTQLNLPFNNFKCEHMAMQLAFKSCRVRVRLRETTKGVIMSDILPAMHLVAQKENTLTFITILILVNFTGIKP